MKKPNLMVIGASGNVANALLHYLVHHRAFFNELILVDRRKNVLKDPYIDHKNLKYKFVHKEIVLPEKEKEYLDLLKHYKIDIVLDITDMESIPIIESTNKKKGISYVNTAMNAEKSTTDQLIFNIYPRKEKLNNAPHILCTGMNPGVVNMLVRCGIEEFGIPKEITHFEYDTSKISENWKAMMTWCIHEFLVEDVRDPGGMMLGRNKVKRFYPNALKNQIKMDSILSPIMNFPVYPLGFRVLHEENVSIAQKYNIPSKFIYAVNMQTMDYLKKKYNKEKKITRNMLLLGDNIKRILDGSDNIGVILEYKDKKVYYLNSVSNADVMGTNATNLQVATGILSALFTLIFDKLKGRIYFVEDLYDTHYKYYLFDNMRIQKFVFEKNKKGLKLAHFNPEIKLKRKNHFEHLYI